MHVDYYAVLGVPPDASAGAIAKAWRRLVLLSHPDKQPHAVSNESKDIILLNEARAVLSDPTRRAAFDEQRLATPSRTPPPQPAGPRIREYVSLDNFTPDDPEDPTRFTLPCRCGHEYVVTHVDLEAGFDVVGCPGCGEYIGVDYEAVEDEDEAAAE